MHLPIMLEKDQTGKAEASTYQLLFDIEQEAKVRALTENGLNRSVEELIYNRPEEGYVDLETFLTGE